MRFSPLNCDFVTPDTKKCQKWEQFSNLWGRKHKLLKYGRNNAFEVLKLTIKCSINRYYKTSMPRLGWAWIGSAWNHVPLSEQLSQNNMFRHVPVSERLSHM